MSPFICEILHIAAGIQVCLDFLQWRPSYPFGSWLATEILSISYKVCTLKTSGQKRCSSGKSLGSLECFAVSLWRTYRGHSLFSCQFTAE